LVAPNINEKKIGPEIIIGLFRQQQTEISFPMFPADLNSYAPFMDKTHFCYFSWKRWCKSDQCF